MELEQHHSGKCQGPRRDEASPLSDNFNLLQWHCDYPDNINISLQSRANEVPANSHPECLLVHPSDRIHWGDV